MLKEFFQINNIAFLENESMKKHTTFKVGGKADFIAMPKNSCEAATIIRHFKENEIPFYFLGKGSNVIFKDTGFKGVVIKTSNMQNVEIDGNKVTADAGVTLNVLCSLLQEKSLSGLEFCYGIPGNVGGAIYMNAGAYGGEISNCIEEIEYLDSDLNVRKISYKDSKFSYRHSIFQENDWLILSSKFNLEKGDSKKILVFMEEIMQKRRDKQPLDKPSAGSSFRRPEGYFAAALIDQCGLKGKTIGGAQISEKHAGFIINIGGATSDDIEALAVEVEQIVLEKTGVKIEKEMIFV